jgi:tetratricopeptide (TPR) repeat protein
MTEDRMFQEAITALNSGQRARARDLLTRLLRTDKINVEYWLYMSTVVDTKKEQIYCLENVLKYAPDNKIATRGLIFLGEMPSDEDVVPVKPVGEREWTLDQIYEGEDSSDLESSKPPRTTLPLAQGISLGVAGLIVILLVVIGLTGNPFFMGIGQSRASGNVGYSPLFTAGPTRTGLFTSTPEGWIAPSELITTPTPLPYLSNTSFTPTPRYVNTPHPDDVDFNMGMQALDRGSYEQAIEYFDSFIESEPTALDARYYRALAYLWKGEMETARDEFLRIIDRDEAFAPAYVGVAQAWLALNPDWVVGDELYKAVSIAPDFIGGHLARAEYRLNRNVPEGVVSDAEAVLAINPDNGMAYYYLASAYLLLDRPAEALDAAIRAQELDSTILENYVVLGQAMVENDRLVDALSPLQTYLDFVDDNGMAWYLSGRARQAAGDHAGALGDFGIAIELREDLLDIYYYSGLSYLALGDIENALKQLRIAGKLFPSWFEVQVALTEAYYKNENYKDANNTIVEAKSSAKTDQQLAFFYYWRAYTFEMMGYLEQAEMDWNALLDLPPGSAPQVLSAEAVTHLRNLAVTPTIPFPSPTHYPTMTPSPPP